MGWGLPEASGAQLVSALWGLALNRGPWLSSPSSAFLACPSWALSLQSMAEKSPGAYFLPEFALSPQGSFLEDTTGEEFLTYHYDDQVSVC